MPGEVESPSFRACIPEAEHTALVLATRFPVRRAACQAVMMLLAVKADCARVKPNQPNQRRFMNPIRMFLLFPVVWAINSLGAAKPDLAGKVVTEAGRPVSNATVFIYTAGPRVGPGFI